MGLIALAVLTLRLLFAFSTPEFAVDQSYAHLRQAQVIKDTGFPISEDTLSFGGSGSLFPPGIDYLIAGLGFITGIPISAKILQNLFAFALILIVFAYAWTATRHVRASVLAALAAGFIPILWHDVVSVSSNLLGVTLGFFLLLCFLRVKERFWRRSFLICLVLLSLASPIAGIFILGLLVYLLLASLADVPRPKGEGEIIFFSFLFVLWLSFVLFKKVFVTHGLGILWQNIPPDILATYFTQISVPDAVVAVGVIPFIAGIYIIYRHIFKERMREVYIIMGIALATGGLVWARLIRPDLGLMILGISLVILFAFAVQQLFSYFDRTKFFRYASQTATVLVFLVLLLSAPLALSSARTAVGQSLTLSERDALLWIDSNTENTAVIAATLDEGHAITALANRANIADTNFLLKTDAAERLGDINTIITSPFESEIVPLLQRYDSDYILWTDRARTLSGKDIPSFEMDEDCFPVAFSSDSVKVYSVACELEES